MTFCNLDDHLLTIEDEIFQKHSMESFLQFTKVRILILIIIYHSIQKTSSTCSVLCDCEAADETIKFSMEDMSNYKVNVVCTDLGLTSLPSCLPPDTIYLNMANNQVDFQIILLPDP